MTPSAAVGTLLATAALASTALDAQEQAGRRIYREGESPSGGEITAIVGGSVVPAAAFPCASCHGQDGRGRREGSVDPSDVTWATLTKRYGHAHANGRRHPPFDGRSFARAVLEGVDPAGNALDAAMPRYSMSRADLDSLVAYLRRITDDVDPGIGADAVALATVVPTRGRLATTGRAIRRTLELSIEASNARGGFHGRTARLVVAEYDSDAESGVAALERTLARSPAFAIVAPFTPGDEAGAVALGARLRVPIVGPVTPFTPAAGAAPETVFYTLGGLREEVGALATRAASELGGTARRAIVLRPEGALGDEATSARDKFAALGVVAEVRSYAPGEVAAPLAAADLDVWPDAVLLLGGDAELAALARTVADAGTPPLLLVPGTLAARAALDAPPGARARVRVAFPLVPDARGDARALLSRVAAEQKLGSAERHGATSAHVAFAVLAEGLRRAGRQLSRDGLVAKIERLQRFDAGVGPPLTYGPARRVGASGAYIVRVDPEGSFRPVGDFIDAE